MKQVNFESECPDYEVQISKDGKNFTTIYSDSNASQGDTVSKQISFDKQEIRYVKYVQHKMWNHSNGKQYSTSIYELEVYKEFNIENELKKLPAKPGVYLMHDASDEIIYVGKAIKLK